MGEEYGDRLIDVGVLGASELMVEEGLWFCGNWQEVPSSWRVLVWHIFLRNYYLKKPVVRPK